MARRASFDFDRCWQPRLQLYDSNCDGMLDFDEFSEGITMCQLDHLFPRSLQRTLFDKIDTDKVKTKTSTVTYISKIKDMKAGLLDARSEYL